MRLVTSIPEPGGQFLGDTSPRWHQKRDSAQLFGAEGGLRREGRILTEQHAPALFVGHTKDVILAALCRFQQQPQIQSALFQALSDVIRSRAVKVELDQRVFLPKGVHQQR